MKSTRTWPLLVSLVLVAVASRAAVVPRMSLEELADRSEFIVHGRVGYSWTAWDRSHRYIWTHYRLEVHDAIKVSGPVNIVISAPGGILDGVGMRASGAVTYTPGEEVVLFLYRTPIGYLRATGYSQGKYAVVQDPDSDQKRLRSNLRSMAFVEASGKSSSAARRETSLDSLDGVALSEFKALIRSLIQRGLERRGQ